MASCCGPHAQRQASKPGRGPGGAAPPEETGGPHRASRSLCQTYTSLTSLAHTGAAQKGEKPALPSREQLAQEAQARQKQLVEKQRQRKKTHLKLSARNAKCVAGRRRGASHRLLKARMSPPSPVVQGPAQAEPACLSSARQGEACGGAAVANLVFMVASRQQLRQGGIPQGPGILTRVAWPRQPQ